MSALDRLAQIRQLLGLEMYGFDQPLEFFYQTMCAIRELINAARDEVRRGQ